jgi:N-hydroxyarylamine O-acetyltransferase
VVDPATTEAVLARIGFSAPPSADTAGLAALYEAWCREVPFDNLVKRIHLTSGAAGPIPNGPAEPFFASYLTHGTGGTCWPSSNALFELIVGVGFDARRGSGAMQTDPTSVPVHSHGTVIVRLDGAEYWVDSSMLSMRVLPLVRGETTRLDDPINPMRAEPEDEFWRVSFAFPITDGELSCLLLDDDVDEAHYLARYEWSRTESPFNTSIFASKNVEGTKLTVAFGTRFERTVAGVAKVPLGPDRDRVLVEEFGYSEEIVASLPSDEPPGVPSNA